MEVSFYLKRAEAKEPTAIFARICYYNNKLKYYPSLKIHPNNWNTDTQQARQTLNGYANFNRRLKDIASDAEDILREFQNNNNGLIPSVTELKELLDLKLKNISTAKDKQTFVTYFEKFIQDSKKGVRVNTASKKPITKGTVRTYVVTQNILKCYISDSKKRIVFEHIDLDFYADFTTYLQEEKLQSLNSIGKHIKIIKTLMNEAAEDGLHNNRAYKSKRFVTVQEKADNIYLNERELDIVAKLDLTEQPSLDRVRDMFIVGCYTGLRFSDFTVLRADQIQDGFIETTQIKTGEPVVIPIHDKVETILQKYNGVLPPAISNQKMNDYLKDVMQKIECMKERASISYTKGGQRITENIPKYKLVSTHTARRSFATNEYKAGTPTDVIMAITGHKTESAFKKYIKATPMEKAQILKAAWQDRRNSNLIALSA